MIPEKIEWEGEVYQYDSYWNEDETIKYGDFDGGKNREAIVSFCGRVNENLFPQPFHLIYKFNNGYPELVKTIVPIAEYLREVRIIDLDRDGQREIAVFSHAGMHFTNLLIFKYEPGEYKCIFENGSACGIELLDRVIFFADFSSKL